MKTHKKIDWMAVAVGVGLTVIGFTLAAVAFGERRLPGAELAGGGLALFGALGTWVVGLGANAYAKASSDLQRRQAVTKSISDFAALRTAVISCKLAHQIVSEMIKLPDDMQATQNGLHTALETAISLLPKPGFTVSPFPVPDSVLGQIHALDAGVAMFHVSVKLFASNHPRAEVVPTAQALKEFKHAMGNLDSLERKAVAVSPQLDELRATVFEV